MQSTKQIKIPTVILEIIPRWLQRKIPDVRPVQGSAYIIRLALISGFKQDYLKKKFPPSKRPH